MQEQPDDSPVRPSLDHPNNITVGAARLIWAPEVAAIEGLRRSLPAGWVLPGGLRTTDKARAVEAATAMARLSKR